MPSLLSRLSLARSLECTYFHYCYRQTDGTYPPVVGAGAELYEEEEEVEDSEWETDDSDGVGGMGEDDVAKAKAAAKRIKAERASYSSSSANEKARSSQPVGTGGLTGLDAAMAELDMDNYDDDESDGGGAANASANLLSLPAGVFSAGTQYYSSNKEDPYLKFGKGPKDKSKNKKGENAANDDDSDFASSSSSEDDATDENDLDDWELRPGQDLLLLAARNEDDVSHLEVWVCEPPGTKESGGGEGAGANTGANVYVHHDVLLAAFPLCLAWFAAPGSLISRGRGGTGDSSSVSFVAVGTMEPGIELWDVDEADAVEPVAVLGPAPFAAEARAAAAEAARIAEAAEDSEDGDGRKSTGTTNKKKKKKSKKGSKGPVAPATPTPLPTPSSSSLPKRHSRKDAAAGGGHADAVLGLAWNGAFRNVLASASADRTVKIWDLASVGRSTSLGGTTTSTTRTTLGTASGPLNSTAPVATFCHHSGKVQAVAFNPADPPVLLTGGFDGVAALVDIRSPAGTGSSRASSSSSVPSWRVGADVEALAWDPSSPTDFYVAAEDGVVSCFDARSAGSGSKPKFRLSAHSKAATALAFAGAGAGSAFGGDASSGGSSSGGGSCIAPGLLATGSTDKKVKLWDVSGGVPELVATADLKVGAVFGLGFGGLDLSSSGGRGPPRPLLAAAGAKGTVAVWDVAADEAVARRWRKTLG